MASRGSESQATPVSSSRPCSRGPRIPPAPRPGRSSPGGCRAAAQSASAARSPCPRRHTRTDSPDRSAVRDGPSPSLLGVVRLGAAFPNRGGVSVLGLLRIVFAVLVRRVLDGRVDARVRVPLFGKLLRVDLVAHDFFLSTARCSCPLFIRERPSTFSFFASL